MHPTVTFLWISYFRSTDTVGGDVKFDIWEEGDFEIGEDEVGEGVGDKCDEKADTFDGIPDSDMEKNEFESSFNYTQHPLVVREIHFWKQRFIELIFL